MAGLPRAWPVLRSGAGASLPEPGSAAEFGKIHPGITQPKPLVNHPVHVGTSVGRSCPEGEGKSSQHCVLDEGLFHLSSAGAGMLQPRQCNEVPVAPRAGSLARCHSPRFLSAPHKFALCLALRQTWVFP